MSAAPLDDAVILAPNGLDQGIAALSAEPVFAAILAEAGPPRFRQRRNGFATLLHIILEQQVSIDAAAAMHRRLSEVCNPLTPGGFLTLDDATLRACGFSRQKAGYARGLAEKVRSGEFDFARLAEADDESAQAALLALKGIGRWSSEVYLLFALGRADVLARGRSRPAARGRGQRQWLSTRVPPRLNCAIAARRGGRGARSPPACSGKPTCTSAGGRRRSWRPNSMPDPEPRQPMPNIRSLCVYCGSSGAVAHPFRAAASELGARPAEAGIELVFGGGRVGLMGLAADAALAKGGRVTGIIPGRLRDAELAHPGVSELVVVDTMYARARR